MTSQGLKAHMPTSLPKHDVATQLVLRSMTITGKANAIYTSKFNELKGKNIGIAEKAWETRPVISQKLEIGHWKSIM